MRPPEYAKSGAAVRDRYSFFSATLGAVAWLAVLAVPAHGEVGLGSIERLFLLALLVIVPLAFRLVERANDNLLHSACLLQPFAAVLVVISFLFPTGGIAALLAAPWMLVTILAGLSGFIWLVRARLGSAVEACFAAGLLMLPIGGVSLVQSRFGATPLGFHEPWVLLVAVHFHYAAFVAPILAGATGRLWQNQIVTSGVTIVTPEVTIRGARFSCVLFRLVAFGVITGSPLMASGFVFHLPWVRAVAAFLLAASLLGQSILVCLILPSIQSRLARALLVASASSILLGMWFAILFTLGDYRGEVWISIPQMARTHGMLNGFGYSLCGLLGWNLARQQVARGNQNAMAVRRRPQTLLSRWE